MVELEKQIEEPLEAWVRQLWRTLQALEQLEQRKAATLAMGGRLEYDVYYQLLQRSFREELSQLAEVTT